jgi:hypothetical protein
MNSRQHSTIHLTQIFWAMPLEKPRRENQPRRDSFIIELTEKISTAIFSALITAVLILKSVPTFHLDFCAKVPCFLFLKSAVRRCTFLLYGCMDLTFAISVQTSCTFLYGFTPALNTSISVHQMPKICAFSLLYGQH